MNHPEIVTRKEWGASPSRGSLVPMNVDTIVLHHAAGYKDDGTLPHAKQRVKQIQTQHQDGNKWTDIAYHYLVSQGGYILEGRPKVNGKHVIGSHVGGHNTNKIGICLLGCYHPPEGDWCSDDLSGIQKENLIKFLKYLIGVYNLSPDKIKVHSEYSKTACPGDNIRKQLGQIRQAVTMEEKKEEEKTDPYIPNLIKDKIKTHLDQIDHHTNEIRRLL